MLLRWCQPSIVYVGKVCIPFDPSQVEQFDVSRVPTLNGVIKDISSGNPTASLDNSLQVFKKFLEKIRLENAKAAKEQSCKWLPTSCVDNHL